MGTHRGLRILMILGLLATSAAYSDDQSPSSNPSNVFTVPEPVTAGTPGKMPQQDRAGSTREAGGLSKTASLIQQVTCVIMTATAAATGDPVSGMMAMQQCQQAEESRKSAEKSDEDAKKLAGWEAPKMPTMKTPQMTIPKNDVKDEKLLPELEKLASSSAPESGEPLAADIPSVAPVEIPPFQPPAKAEPEGTPVAQSIPALPAPPATSVPGGIRAKLGYDESGKSGEQETPERSLGAGTVVATAKPAEVNKADAALRAAIGDKKLAKMEDRLAKTPEGFGAPAGGSSEAAPEPKDNGSLDNLLAALNGRHPEPEPKIGGEIFTLNSDGNDEDAVNLFEYARYRYKKAALVEKRIRSGKSETMALR